MMIISLALISPFSCHRNMPAETLVNSPKVIPSSADTLTLHDWDDIVVKGKLRVILKNSPTGYFLYRGRPMGFEYELLSRFCDRHKINLEVILESDMEKCFAMLNEGKCDVIAHNLTITKERRKDVEFTVPQYEVRQMLVQRLPDGYAKMKSYQIENLLIRDPVTLIGREIHVRKNSSYYDRLIHLSEEMGGDIKVIQEFGDIQTE